MAVGAGTTRAVVARSYGGPEVLAVVDTAISAPGVGEVRIEVRAAATNPFDVKLYSGVFGQDPARLPMRLGAEAAGVVSAVSDGAQGADGPVRVGDEVIAFPSHGAYAADLVVPAASILPKPAGLTFEQVSGLMLTGTTAVHALKAAGVGPGDTVLIYGASGGVGLMAVQLALLAGARVIASAREDRHASLSELGADPIDYGAGELERIRALAPDGLDAAIDTVGSDAALETSVALVADHARIVTLVGFQRALELGVKAIGSGPGGDPGSAIRSAARIELARLAEQGKLQVRVAATYWLTEVAAAHRLLASGHSHGKVVLVP